ncbi:hypothetical protein J437_LFUL003345 [Ladona fulva]|uniref:Uncharacterized protein n=1 Tax=Ladona fulva TaxID=123851 RepID=A0A8K0K2X3_LADFU|nr:hypothetical protein J437_LFUL003345 [Ladona fulva]
MGIYDPSLFPNSYRKFSILLFLPPQMQPITIASNGRNSSRRPRGTSAGGSVTLPGLPLLVPIALLLLATSGVFTPLSVEAGPLGSSEDFRAGSGSGHVLGHPISKRSFFDIQCKGVYDKSIFARLDRICEDCYNLFREPTLHSLCSFPFRLGIESSANHATLASHTHSEDDVAINCVTHEMPYRQAGRARLCRPLAVTCRGYDIIRREDGRLRGWRTQPRAKPSNFHRLGREHVTMINRPLLDKPLALLFDRLSIRIDGQKELFSSRQHAGEARIGPRLLMERETALRRYKGGEELFHDGILQGLPRRLAAYGRFGQYSKLDKTVAWGRSRGLGLSVSAARTSKGAWKPYFSARRRTSITRWLTSWGSKVAESRWCRGCRSRTKREEGPGRCGEERKWREAPEVIGRARGVV